MVRGNSTGQNGTTTSQKNSNNVPNGIRRIACFIVFIGHVSDHHYRYTNYPYGAGPAPENHGISQLPFLRIIYAGGGMVCISFCAVRIRSVVLVSSQDGGSFVFIVQQSACRPLRVSLLRHGIRLSAPTIVLAFLTCLVTWNYQSFILTIGVMPTRRFSIMPGDISG